MLENLSQISAIYSYLGNRVLEGDVEAIKFFYGNIWKETSPLIRTISLLQENLTSVEIEADDKEKYSSEFLYYWAMICIGEQSNLIYKNLETARTCLEKIKTELPKANARLAYIMLLQSKDINKSEDNIIRLDVLRRYAGKQDFFSRIALARIVFYQFLNEEQADYSKESLQVLNLLELPCRKGHPVAIRFRNEVLTHMGTLEAMDRLIDENYIKPDVLYDFETSSNMQIGS